MIFSDELFVLQLVIDVLTLYFALESFAVFLYLVNKPVFSNNAKIRKGLVTLFRIKFNELNL